MSKRNQRFRCPRRNHLILRKDPQPATRDLKPLQQRNVEVIQFHPAIEACTQRLNHPPFQNRRGPTHHHLPHRRSNHNRHQQRNKDPPSPHSSPPYRRALFRALIYFHHQNSYARILMQKSERPIPSSKLSPITIRNLLQNRSLHQKLKQLQYDLTKRAKPDPPITRPHPLPPEKPPAASPT